MSRLLALLLCTAGLTHAFTAPRSSLVAARGGTLPTRNTQLTATPDDDEPELFGGYTAKQRMREEIESPFRKLRLIFFGASTGSALLALYFSILNVAKAATGGIPVSKLRYRDGVASMVRKVTRLPHRLLERHPSRRGGFIYRDQRRGGAGLRRDHVERLPGG